MKNINNIKIFIITLCMLFLTTNVISQTTLRTTSDLITYNTTHEKPINGYNYYRLTQVDYDGQFETFNPISVITKVLGEREYIVIQTNLIGQEVDEYYSGPILILWNNGEVSREFKLR